MQNKENEKQMECRLGCGACCIAPSISSPIPNMPNGKAAGVRYIQLDDDNYCKIFGQADRPEVCLKFNADRVICGNSRQEAMKIIYELEMLTE